MHYQLALVSTLATFGTSAVISRANTIEAAVEHGNFFNIFSQAGCTHLNNVTMDYGTLPPPSAGLHLYHIAIGRGTQNYSCSASGGAAAAPVALGALATLYNATCLTGLLGTSMTDQLTDFAAKQSRNVNVPSLLQSGHHYFSDLTTPTFNLHTTDANYGIDFAKKANAVAAPSGASTSQDGSAAVPWLKLAVEIPPVAPYSLSAADTNTVAEIYRLNTAGGSAPATCADHVGTNFTQEYAAEYWFWSS